jgi:hypothetical protein
MERTTMRTKKEYKVITFSTTSDAMAMEKFCEKNNISGRLIPVPSEISAGCGLAWRILLVDISLLSVYISNVGNEIRICADGFDIKIEAMVDMAMY